MILSLCFAVSWALAQEKASISGLVKDSIGNGIAGAMVSLVNSDGAGIAFTKTNDAGAFSCEFSPAAQVLSIKVNALGYQVAVLPVSLNPTGTLTITLKKTVTQLKEVVIKSAQKISLSNDTLNYSVKAFKDQNDRVIADMISRLPGMQVDDKGGISFNGKRIANVYIDGDNLLDGNYRLATSKVPVGAVEQVQVIEHEQPIKALNGYVLSDNVSLNLKLTDSARTTMVNNGFVGLGNKAYTGELNNLLFRKGIKSINSLKANNIGESLQSENETIGATFNSDDVLLKKPLPYLSIASEVLPTIDERHYLMNHDFSGNVNTLLKLQSDWSLRLNLASVQLQKDVGYRNAVNYFLANADTIRYTEQQDHSERLNHWNIQAQAEKNGSSAYLKSITKLDLPKWKRKGLSLQNQDVFSQQQPTDYLSLSNETQVVKALGINHILQYNSTIQYYKTNENLYIQPGVQQDLLNDGTAYLQLRQQAGTNNIFINESLSYKAKTKRWILSLAAGLSVERNQLHSNLFKTDSTSAVSDLGSRFKNDVTFKQLAFFAKASAIYLIPRGSITIEAQPTYSFINYGSPDVMPKKNNYLLANPLIEFRQNLGKYSELNFRYAQQSSFGKINDIYSGTMLLNYRQLSANDTPLPRSDAHSFGLRYAYKRPLQLLFYNLYLNYERTKQNFITSYLVSDGITRTMAINFANTTDNYTLNTGLSKYLFFMATQVVAYGSLNLQQGNSYYNNQLSPFDAYRYSLAVTARKKLLRKITLSLGGEWSESINLQKMPGHAAIRNTSMLRKLKASYQHLISNELSYTLNYQFATYRQWQQPSVRNNFLDMSIRFAPAKWKSHFELQGSNLLNQDQYRQLNTSANQLSVFELPLRRRTVLLQYVFSF